MQVFGQNDLFLQFEINFCNKLNNTIIFNAKKELNTPVTANCDIDTILHDVLPVFLCKATIFNSVTWIS